MSITFHNLLNSYSNIYLTRCNVTQFILSGNCSTCFGWYFHPSSRVQTIVSTAYGICHTVTAICPCPPPPQEIFLVLNSVIGWVNPIPGRIMSMKNSNDTIGNQTRDLRAFSEVPQPTAPPRTKHHCRPVDISYVSCGVWEDIEECCTFIYCRLLLTGGFPFLLQCF